MCLIVASEGGKIPSREEVKNAQANNHDGFGAAYLDADGTIKTVYDLTPNADLYPIFEQLQGKAYIAHFRYATHGDVNRVNAHPFRVTDGLYVAHNGIIKIPCIVKGKSDTWHFVKQHLSPRAMTCITPKTVQKLSELIGPGNKLAFLDKSGGITLVNEKQGTWAGGVWYSNLYSLSAPIPYVTDWKNSESVKLTEQAEPVERLEFECEIECEMCPKMVKFLTEIEGTYCCDTCAAEYAAWLDEEDEEYANYSAGEVTDETEGKLVQYEADVERWRQDIDGYSFDKPKSWTSHLKY